MEEQGGTAMEGFEALGAEIGQREDEYGGLKWFMDDESSFLPECPYHGLQLGELIDTNKNVQVLHFVCSESSPAVLQSGPMHSPSLNASMLLVLKDSLLQLKDSKLEPQHPQCSCKDLMVLTDGVQVLQHTRLHVYSPQCHDTSNSRGV